MISPPKPFAKILSEMAKYVLLARQGKMDYDPLVRITTQIKKELPSGSLAYEGPTPQQRAKALFLIKESEEILLPRLAHTAGESEKKSAVLIPIAGVVAAVIFFMAKRA